MADPASTHPAIAPTHAPRATPVDVFDDAFLRDRLVAHRACHGCPAPAEVAAWLDDLLGLAFPELARRRFRTLDALRDEAEALRRRLAHLLGECPDAPELAPSLARAFLADFPDLHARLDEDAQAIADGDPAAHGRGEVIRTYPGFYAIAAHRVAHALLGRGARTLARMIAAHAHRSTGIDVHPAALIGRRFCIDHGTGVVIGETAVLGDDVKLYQGVTLGGHSVRKEDAARKRHPTIGNRVVVYAGATILGGATVVGDDSVIGGNVWLTRSVPSGTKLTYRPTADEVERRA
ncbi:MAG: serine O-acetyltransferase [Trueperaceae bacterium]